MAKVNPPAVHTTAATMAVHSSVLFKLGEDLITDEGQALAELVKNAYDADADYAVIRIVTNVSPPAFPSEWGYVEVIDNGTGMTLDQIMNGWLTVSNSVKMEMKNQRISTATGRVPLGDKGLGRLGAQRLGNRLTIDTTPKGGKVTHQVSLDWRSFLKCKTLSELQLEIHTMPATGEAGTTVTISDLHNVDLLADHGEIQKRLANIISPYRGVSAFQMFGSVNGSDLDFEGFEESIRQAAVLHYDVLYGPDDEMQIFGKMRLHHLRPNARKDREGFARICESDNGKALLAFIMKEPVAKDFKVRPSSQQGWWVEFETNVRLCDLDPVFEGQGGRLGPKDQEDAAGAVLATPGPFLGEIDGFNLGAGAAERIKGFDSIRILRNRVAELAGIRVYRNGFHIRTGADWLGLGRAWTSGRSWYGLRPGNTMGYIELSTEGNPQLIETTDREGFRATPHYENFVKVMDEFVVRSHVIQECIARSWLKFRRQHSMDNGGVTRLTTEEVTSQLSKTLGYASRHREALVSLYLQLSADTTAIETALAQIDQTADNPVGQRESLVALLITLKEHLTSAMEVSLRLEQFVGDLGSQHEVGQRLQAELDTLEDQLALTYETMSVGLTAEALSHEIANITDRLAERTNQIQHVAGPDIYSIEGLQRYLEYVRGSVSGLRRQLAHLAPSLRYVRDKKETIQLSVILSEVEGYFSTRWRKDDIVLFLNLDSDPIIRTNRGRMIQVFDNLLLNSEYWIRQELRAGRLRQGRITIQVVDHLVVVMDNGPGVAPEIEHSLFEPFTTLKPKGKGRGLGLFITSQLLAADGCGVSLAPELNHRSRRFKFVIDLGGVIQQ